MGRELYTLAFPQLKPNDLEWIERLRAKYVPEIAAMVGAHFTLAFGHGSINQSAYSSHVSKVAAEFSPMNFRCRSVTVGTHHEDASGYVFLVPDEGHDAILRLHERLHTGILTNQRRWDIPFRPHLTLGHFTTLHGAQVECERLMETPIFVEGTIDSVTVVAVEGNTPTQIAATPFSEQA